MSHGRIRISTAEDADLLHEMVRAERHRSVVRRADAKERGEADGVSAFNRRIERIGRFEEELDRMMDEMGWTATDQ